jgi:regulator of protease activity HflC (stomatin/prohibitin superfamily)
MSSLTVFSGLIAGFLFVLVYRTLRFFKPRLVTIYDYQQGVLYSGGRFRKVVEPGQHWTSTRTQIYAIDLRAQFVQVPGQEIITTDGIAIKLSAFVEYAIADPALSIRASNNLLGLLYAQAQQAIRAAVSEMAFEALLTSRDAIGAKMLEFLAPRAAEIGIKISSCLVRDIMLPSDIRRAYAQSVKAQKEGLAALERGRGETASLRALANAARMLQDNPGLLQLRAVQAIETSKGNHTLTLDLSPNAKQS